MRINVGARVKRASLATGATLTAGAALVAMAVPASASPQYFKTVGTDVHIRKCASVSYPCTVVKTLHAAGTQVHAICWIQGSSVNGDNIWYEVDEPAHGAIAGYWINSGTDPNPKLTHCYS